MNRFKICSLICAAVFTVLFPLNTFASTANAMEAESASEYLYIDQHGNEYIFPTAEDYGNFLEAHKIQPRYGEMWLLDATLVTTNLNHYFVGYHSGTPNWIKASSYTISSGQNFNVSASYPWQGVSLNIGFSYSYSVATTIPANASKYSRLGVYADYTLKKERYAEYSYGQPTGNTRISTYAVRTANYIDPVYQ